MKKINILILLLFAFSCFDASATHMHQRYEKIELWQGTSEKHHARQVLLTPFITKVNNPANNGVVVIICPGGSYTWLSRYTEGEEVAKWLNNNGISAFVLDYRVQGTFAYIHHSRNLVRGKRFPDATRDLQKAMKYVKEHADEYGITINKLGLMGFSAGGHLVMTSVCNPEANVINNSEIVSPDFIVPIYPVVSMRDTDNAHRRSRRALLGDNRKNNKVLQDSLSTYLHIPNNCPPVFIACCKDDQTVNYRNSILLDSALTAKNIPHEFHLYETGGHGFGASDTKGSEESRQWMQSFLNWIK